MDFEPTICTHCYNFFNKDDRLPLIIPTCGHTFCSSCIESVLSKVTPYEPFLCPKDRNPVDLTSTDISQFPKNFIVMKQIEAKQASIIPTAVSTTFSTVIPTEPVKKQLSLTPTAISTTFSTVVPTTPPQNQINHMSITPTATSTIFSSGRPTTPTQIHTSHIPITTSTVYSTARPTTPTQIESNYAPITSAPKYSMASPTTPTHHLPNHLSVSPGAISTSFSSVVPTTTHHPHIEDMSSSTIIHSAKPDGFFEKSYSMARETSSPFNGLKTASSKNVSRGGISISRYDSSAGSIDGKMCAEHGKKLEFVCLDHKCRVCSNCGLVGAHKGHDIKSEEEVFKEIENKAEKLTELFASLDKEQTVMPEDQFASMYEWKIKDKQKELEKRVISKFDEFRAILKAKEDRILDEIKSKFSLLDIRFKPLNHFPSDLKFKVQFWKDSVQSLFSTVSERIEKGEIIYELLEGKHLSQPNLLKEGTTLTQELNKHKGSPIQSLEKELSQLTVSFNNNFGNMVDTLCSFQAPQPDIGGLTKQKTLDTDNDRTGAIRTYPKGSPEKRPNTEREVKRTMASPGSGVKPTAEDKFSVHSSNFGGANTVYVDLTNYVQREHIASPSQGASSMRLPALNMDAAHTRDESHSRSQRTPRNMASKSPRSVSPAGRSTSAKPTRKKLKVPVKYEGVVEGLEADKIDAADLFDADLGDNGVTALAELLKGNTRLKTLKLVKNKITDEGAVALIDALYKNNSIENLHLSQNLLTDKTIELFLEYFKKKSNIRTIFFNRNSINLRNVKDKVKQIMELGVSISI